jgi:hypothetical protein
MTLLGMIELLRLSGQRWFSKADAEVLCASGCARAIRADGDRVLLEDTRLSAVEDDA